jgi:hypothetical protein
VPEPADQNVQRSMNRATRGGTMLLTRVNVD